MVRTGWPLFQCRDQDFAKKVFNLSMLDDTIFVDESIVTDLIRRRTKHNIFSSQFGHNIHIKVVVNINEVPIVDKKEVLKKELNKRHEEFLNSSMGKEIIANNKPQLSRKELNTAFREIPQTLSKIIRESREV